MSKKAQEGSGESRENCPRPYRLGQRETAMEETQRRVLAAARELILGENALAGFSMEAVARQAGVTRMTVYHRFGSKRGLLEALFDEIGRQGRLAEKMPEVFMQSDPLKAMRAYIEAFCDFWESDRALNRRLRGFASLDKEFEAAIASRYERRHHAIEILLNRLRPSSADREEMARTLLALTGFEFYDTLSEGLSPEQAASIIFRLVLGVLGIRDDA